MYAIDRFDHLGRRDDIVEAPAVGVAHVHVLDEADDVAGPFEVGRHVDDGVLVDAPLHHGVDLDRAQTGVCGDFDRIENRLNREPHVVHRLECRIVHGVETHSHPVETSFGEPFRLSRQQRGIGGHREVVDTVDAGQHRHQLLDPLA